MNIVYFIFQKYESKEPNLIESQKTDVYVVPLTHINTRTFDQNYINTCIFSI